MSKEKNRYAVVAFDSLEVVSVVPHNLLFDNDTRCYWPHYCNPGKTAKSIKVMTDPQADWTKHPVRVISKCGKCAHSVCFVSHPKDWIIYRYVILCTQFNIIVAY